MPIIQMPIKDALDFVRVESNTAILNLVGRIEKLESKVEVLQLQVARRQGEWSNSSKRR